MHSSKQASLSGALTALLQIPINLHYRDISYCRSGSLRAVMLTAIFSIEKRRYTVLDAPGRSPFIVHPCVVTTTFKVDSSAQPNYAVTL